MTPLRLLFVKESQSWPRSSGHDVHGFNMMKAFAARGNAVSLATVIAPEPQAIEGLPLVSQHTLAGKHNAKPLQLNTLERKFADYFGVPDDRSHALAAVLGERKFDAVIVIARHLLPLFSVVKNAVRVWYPADDPAWHHLSRFKLHQRKTWGELKLAAVNAIYERAFRSRFDRVWVVSTADRMASRLIAGCRQVDLIPNGVDADYYSPQPGGEIPRSAVFWGRLDFGPNVEALEWFLAKVWPTVKARVEDARFDVFGFNPTPPVRKLAETHGVDIHPDLPDIRGEVRRRQVVVLPFVSGGGIKNKLLEAASMGLPIVCTRWALSGVKGQPPMVIPRSPGEWANELAKLWQNTDARSKLGLAAREWVTRHHTWDAAAAVAEVGIRRSMRD